MASYLKPRRGTKAQATATLTGSNRLKAGEIFFEVPPAGVGKGEGRLMMGDGATDYASLTPFLDPTLYAKTTTSYDTTASSASTVDDAINNMNSASTIPVFKGNVSKAINLLKTAFISADLRINGFEMTGALYELYNNLLIALNKVTY